MDGTSANALFFPAVLEPANLWMDGLDVLTLPHVFLPMDFYAVLFMAHTGMLSFGPFWPCKCSSLCPQSCAGRLSWTNGSGTAHSGAARRTRSNAPMIGGRGAAHRGCSTRLHPRRQNHTCFRQRFTLIANKGKKDAAERFCLSGGLIAF